MEIIEITSENYEQYKNKLLSLEKKVKADMVKQGIGDLFFTTGEDIIDYVVSPLHHVFAMVDNNEVLAQTYLIGSGSHIQGDYSDLPKYYTMGDDFLSYVKKDKYESDSEFMRVGRSMYIAKIYAFKYALGMIYGDDYNKFMEDLEYEKKSETHFDERTKLRRDINRYMSEFMKKYGMSELYRQFYYIDSSFIDYSGDIITKAYDSFLEASKVKVYGENIENHEDYFEANVDNTIEVDTYITDPEARRNGDAKILSTIALSKTINEFFENNDSDVLYLSITLHKDNYLSENVANFLGFKDYIDLERRSNIERKAYMKRIDRTNYLDYINYLNKKLSYFYGFGNEEITEEDKELFEMEKINHNIEIIKEIERRISLDEFDNSTRDFVENIRDNIKVKTLK